MTEAPSRANRRPAAAPMPLLAPVIYATFPRRRQVKSCCYMMVLLVAVLVPEAVTIASKDCAAVCTADNCADVNFVDEEIVALLVEVGKAAFKLLRMEFA